MKFKSLASSIFLIVNFSVVSQINATTVLDTVIISSGDFLVPLGDLYTNTTGSGNAGVDIYSSPTVNIFNNQGSITSTDSAAILNENGSIGILTNGSPTNSAQINGLTGIRNGYGGSGAISTINNYGVISGSNYGEGGIVNNNATSTIGAINNYGTISASGVRGGAIANLGGSINSIVNGSASSITATGSTGYGIFNNGGSITSIDNSGTISATGANSIGIYNYVSSGSSTIGAITNESSATISGATYGIYNRNTITTITNSGAITGGTYGITNTGTITTINNYSTINGGILNNGGTIGTLNNAQNGLNFANPAFNFPNLPSRYNIIVTSPSNYGSINFNSINGSTTFGVSNLSTLSARTYTQVLSGIGALGISNLLPNNTVSGTLGSYAWVLQLESVSSADVWDLVVTSLIPPGPSTVNTQSSVQLSANSLKGVYALQTAAITNGLTYDCSIFDKNGICVSAGGRYDRVNTGDTHATNGLLIGSYKVDANTRVGAWVDQNLSASSATGVNLNNGNPMFGVFGVWNADKSGNGFEARLSAGYGDKDLTTTRQVVGSSQASEAGTGKTRLNTQGVSAVVSYNYPVAADLTLSPYLGARYTRVNANGYTEATSSTVTTPLTLSALKQETTTALAGLKVSARMSPECGVFGSIGAELDTNNQGNNYSATGVTGLTAIAFNADTKRLRGVASVGTYYDLDKTQRISLNAVYREEAFQKVNTLSTMATYTAGF